MNKRTAATLAAFALMLAGTAGLTGCSTQDDSNAVVVSNGEVISSPPSTQKVDDPDTIKPLSKVDAKCPWAKPTPDDAVSIQDGDLSAMEPSNWPNKPSATALKCAEARALAAGFTLWPDGGKSVSLNYDSISPYWEGSHNWEFKPLIVASNPNLKYNALCVVHLIVIDYQGNYTFANGDPVENIDALRSDALKQMTHPDERAICSGEE